MASVEREDVPYGYCQCGCGERTPLAKSSRKSQGRVKGEPCNFIRGHYMKIGAARTDEERRANRRARRARNKDKIRAQRKAWRDRNKQKIRARRQEKYRTDAAFREQRKRAAREYYHENRGKVRDRLSEYYEKHPERLRQSRAKYRSKPEVRARMKEYLAEWNEDNRHKRREYQARYRRRHPDRRRVGRQNRRARTRGRLPLDITGRLMKKQRGKCVACRANLRETGHHLDHKIPLAKGGPHCRSNVQLLCPHCNMSKGARDPIEFMQEKGWLL